MRLFILFFILTLPQMLSAQEKNTLSLKSNPFNEIVRDAAKISGARLLGLVSYGKPRKGAQVPTFSALVPKDWAGEEICMRVISSDGLYEAENTYVVAQDWLGGIAELHYPTENPNRIANLLAGEIAISVSRGECANGGDEITISFWNSDSSGKAVSLLVNSFRAEETYVYFDGEASIPEIKCQRSDAVVRASFDTVCLIPTEGLQGGAVHATILPIKNGEMGKELTIVLHLGQLNES